MRFLLEAIDHNGELSHPHASFLVGLDVAYQALLGAGLVWLGYQFFRQMIGVGFPKAFKSLWGANALTGQLFIGVVAAWIVYRIHMWWALPAPAEFGAILAIAGIFLTMAPPATEHDIEHEQVVKWILTFVGMVNSATLLSTLVADTILCGPPHECNGPSQFINMGGVIFIGIASLVSGMLSRRSRWSSFMAMNPPTRLVRVLQVIGPGSGRWILRDEIVKAFLLMEVEQVTELLEEKVRPLLSRKQDVLLDLAKQDIWFFRESEPESHHPYHEEHEEHGLHPV